MTVISNSGWRVICALALLSAHAPAAEIAAINNAFPMKPVRCIVPFAPGGGADGIGRLMQPAVDNALGQSFVLDNRPGGSGVIGSEIAARSAPAAPAAPRI